MDQRTCPDPALENVQKCAQQDQAKQLREERKTFSEIGVILGVTPAKARYLFLSADRRNIKRHTWTEGLNERLANSLHWLGFEDKKDVTAALKSGHLQTLARYERGLRPPAIAELRVWLDMDDEPTNAPASQRIETTPADRVSPNHCCTEEQQDKAAG